MLLWGAGTALIGGGVLYFQPEWRKQAALIRDVPAVRDSVNAVSQRMQKAEANIQSWARDREGFGGRLDLLETRWSEQARQMRQMRDGIMARVHNELAQYDSRVNSRLTGFEAQREEDQATIAGMRRQIAELGTTVARQQARLVAMESNASADKQVLEQQVAGIRDDSHQDRGELRELSRSLEPQRINFEISRNHSQHLAPGVSLCVTNTDVAHRRVSGWMWIMPDRKTIWLRGQGAMQPVIYYSAVDGKRREVVFTSVTNSGAVGYMLLPAEPRHVAMASRTWQ